MMECLEKVQSVKVAGSVPQTDTGRRGENPKVYETTSVKELGKTASVTSGDALSDFTSDRSERSQATVYQKRRSLPNRKVMYRGRPLASVRRLRGWVSPALRRTGLESKPG